jgi:hypothetical protein
LHPIYYLVEVLVQLQNSPRTHAVGVNELLDASVAHAHQGKLGSGKEGVRCHEQEDEKNPQQHESNHGSLILTFQRE